MRTSSSTCSMRSLRREQQMQPFSSATRLLSFCCTMPLRWMREASMFTSPMSLTITAQRSPSLLHKRWLSRVVLPLPR
ncbi:hypothetical protein EVA_05580 [gut metagenome]|uniref:Uncharacterized protein n=1 Tax=gut metagenome TaxID=749906 RepID=J9GH21_9ZZZZ